MSEAQLVKDGYRPKVCSHCPFRRDIRPFLHPDRYEELADNAMSSYSTFPCHKTTGSDDDGETMVTNKTLQCAGFTQMQSELNGFDMPEGMTENGNIFDYYDMLDAHDTAEWSCETKQN